MKWMRFAAAAGLVLACSPLSANWQAVETKDEFTDRISRNATHDGPRHKIQIARLRDDVWMLIARKAIGTFEPNGIVEYRVDNNETRTLNPPRLKLIEKTVGRQYVWEPSAILFSVWSGNEADGDCGFIGELIRGSELKVRYQTDKLSSETFTVSLAGSGAALRNALQTKTC